MVEEEGGQRCCQKPESQNSAIIVVTLLLFLGFWQNLYDVNPLEEGRDIFSCEVCGKEFRNEGSLAQHKPIHRVNTTCQICGTTLSRVQHYRRHLRTVHNIDPKLMGRESEAVSVLP